MGRERLKALLLVLAVLAQIFAATGAFHDHLTHGDQPGSCVSCGAATQTAHVPAPAPQPVPASTVPHAALAVRAAPRPPTLVLVDARGPPRAA